MTAKPNPTPHDLQVQVGCHIEEFEEFLTELELADDDYQGKHLLGQAMLIIDALANHLKDSQAVVLKLDATTNVLDAIADGMVTGTGVAYMLGMDLLGGLDEVNRSNFSKFDPDTGLPVLKSNGKIGKHFSYTKPNLAPFLVLQQPVAADDDSVVDSATVVFDADADEVCIVDAAADAADDAAAHDDVGDESDAEEAAEADEDGSEGALAADEEEEEQDASAV